MNLLPRVFLPLSLCGLLTSCDLLKNEKLLLTMHVQSMEVEHPREIMTIPIGDQQMTFKKIPEFSQRSIAAFDPFPAEDGQGFGALLQLDAKGRNALETVSRLEGGMAMLTMSNAVPIDMVELDKPISDGRFTIWRGLSQETIDLMDKKYPRIKHMKSASRWLDMLPSTEKEKSQALRTAREAEAAEKAAQRAKERGVVPKAPTTRDIPLEGFKPPGT